MISSAVSTSDTRDRVQGCQRAMTFDPQWISNDSGPLEPNKFYLRWFCTNGCTVVSWSRIIHVTWQLALSESRNKFITVRMFTFLCLCFVLQIWVWKTYIINVIISKSLFIIKIYLFMGHQYFDYNNGPLKLFGLGPKITLIWTWWYV